MLINPSLALALLVAMFVFMPQLAAVLSFVRSSFLCMLL